MGGILGGLFGGDETTVTVTINGNAAPLQEALSQAQARVNEFSSSASSQLNSGFGIMAQGANGLTEAFTGLLGGMGNFLVMKTAMVAAMLEMQVIQQVTSWVQDFTDALFQLNQQMEKTNTGWQYMFGNVKNGVDVTGNAARLMNWTYSYSTQLPFTRQDLNAAISALAPMGLNVQGIEQYLPVVADLAATRGAAAYGGRGLTLQQAAYAVMSAQMGMPRMLRHDLMINPEDLVKYGLAYQGHGIGGHITDPTTLLPALEKYSEAHGYTKFNSQGQDKGAAFDISQRTFWGGWSSFMDRIQNFEITAGGTNPNGTIRKGSFFGTLRDDLMNISQWWDQHGDTINKLADTFGKLFGSATQQFGQGFLAFLKGMQDSGLGKQILDGIQSDIAWLSDPKNQQSIKDMATTIGTNLGSALKDLGDDFKSVKTGWDNFKNAFTPDEISAIGGAFQALGGVFNWLAQQIGRVLTELGDVVTVWNDISSGDWKKAQQDILQAESDYVAMETGGLLNIPGAHPNPGGAAAAGGVKPSGSPPHASAGAAPASGPVPWAPHPTGPSVGGGGRHYMGGLDGAALIPALQNALVPLVQSGAMGGMRVVNNHFYGVPDHTLRQIARDEIDASAARTFTSARRPGNAGASFGAMGRY